MPYTYLIGWTKLNLWYYGVRYKKGCDPNDLWNPYRTSSKYVKQICAEHGDPDIIQVRKTFNTVDEARSYETKILSRLKVVDDSKWINKTTNISRPPMYGTNNPATKIETRNKISNTLLDGYASGRIKPVSAWNKGLSKENDVRLEEQSIRMSKRMQHDNPMTKF